MGISLNLMKNSKYVTQCNETPMKLLDDFVQMSVEQDTCWSDPNTFFSESNFFSYFAAIFLRSVLRDITFKFGSSPGGIKL